MASGYALPTSSHGGNHNPPHHSHGHSHSYSGTHLSPSKAASSAFPLSNGGTIRKAVSNGNILYSHAETSNENTPVPSPLHTGSSEYFHTPAEHNAAAFQDNTRAHSLHSYSPSRSLMKGRARGESDLGRPADHKSSAYKSMLTAPTSWFSLPEALTSLLIPLPYMLASAVYSSVTGEMMEGGFPPLPAYARMQHGANGGSVLLPKKRFSKDSGIAEACALTAGTLLLVGLAARIPSTISTLDRRKDTEPRYLLQYATIRSMGLRALSLGLPFYASIQIGGMRVGLLLLASIAANITCSDVPTTRSPTEWKHLLRSRIATMSVIAASFVTDAVGWTYSAPHLDLLLGYLALTCSIFLLNPPLPSASGVPFLSSSSKISSPSPGAASWSRRTRVFPVLASSPHEANVTLLTGILLSLLTVALSVWLAISPSHYSKGALTFGAMSIVVMAAATLFARPPLMRSRYKAGLGFGSLISASCAFLYSPALWPGVILNGGLSALSFLGVLYDTNGSLEQTQHDDHDHEHAHNVHTHHSHNHGAVSEGTRSAITRFMMDRCEPGSLVYGILSEKDSRRIAYFTLLNFAFMLVQGVYGYLSGSLGLLSDTVHMFFDCLGLVVGLGAAVASKWPTSPEKPYGWGKLNTLAGFGNGIFLMLVSVEFVWEAVEGMLEGTTLRHVKELLVVSSLGLLVNMVGLFAFGHAHAGHDHSHGQSHAHSHSHEHSNGHLHRHDHDHDHGCDHSHDKPQATKDHHAHHGHEHGHNENMHGIFLHVAADAGGSLAVIISTALTLWKPWYLWDPLATIIIAVLIFAAAVPLVISSGQKLLLVIPDDLEYNIKTTLQELGELRGVVGYAVPRFWVDDKEEVSEAHGHGHDHSAVHHAGGQRRVMGVIHVITTYSADPEDVRERVEDLARQRGMDLLIHIEREADGVCWCGGSAAQKSG